MDGYRAVKTEHILHDLDSKFAEQCCAIGESDDIVFELIPPRSPNPNPFAERWVQSFKCECLGHFILFGEAHLRYLIENYVGRYNKDRPHQGLGNLRIGATKPAEVEGITPADLVCHERLGGLLKHYELKAA